jgi:type I restriction enzyme, S subunit
MESKINYVSLNEISTIQTGKKDANYGDKGGEYPFFTCADKPILSPTYSFDGESIILPGNGANVGMVFYHVGKFEAYQRTYVLNNIKCNSRYLFHHLSAYWKKFNLSKQFGSATNYIRMQNFLDYTIPLPPIASQRTIANILDKADEIIRKRKEAIALTEQLQKSIFLDMFGDPVINPKGWEVVQLSKIADFENGDRSSNYPSGKDIIENGILFLNTKNIVNNQLNLGIKQYISEEKFNSLTRGKLKKGDLLITLRGTLGNCCIFESEYRTGFINAQMMIIRVKPNISNKFIHALLTSKQLNNFLQMIGNGAAIPQLTAKQIKELGVYNPPIELQNKFSDFIEKITKLKEKHYQNLQESENLFNSLLQKAFKGEL